MGKTTRKISTAWILVAVLTAAIPAGGIAG